MTKIENNNCTLPVTGHGTIDITGGVPDGLIHVTVPRVGPTCKRLGIDYGKALVGWNEVGRSRNKTRFPVLSGVVITGGDYSRLMEALEDKEKKRSKKVEQLPILAALFTLNRRAKRCRDLAQTYYESGMHGFAAEMRQEKKRIYYLKGQTLHHMNEAGVLVGGKFHQFEFGNWAEVLEGDGYSFHRPCPPQEQVDEKVLFENIEAKPKQTKEPTLEIAYDVIARFLLGKNRVSVYTWPAVIRSRRKQDWNEEDEDEEVDDDFDEGEE